MQLVKSVDRFPLIDLIFFDAGGGHRASATALKSALEARHRSWQVRMVNLRDALEPIDFIRRFTGIRLEDLYNELLRHGLTIAAGSTLPILHMLLRQTHSSQVSLLAQFWRNPRPNLVVSMIPHFNRAILDGLRVADSTAGRTATPMATLMTDLADFPPHFWLEKQRAIHRSAAPIKPPRRPKRPGYRPERIFRSSGMILRPIFYRDIANDRRAAREAVGLDPDLPTGTDHVRRLWLEPRRRSSKGWHAAAAGEVQTIVMCGHNEKLRAALLRRLSHPTLCKVSPAMWQAICGWRIFSSASPAPAASARHWYGPAVNIRAQRFDDAAGTL